MESTDLAKDRHQNTTYRSNVNSQYLSKHFRVPLFPSNKEGLFTPWMQTEDIINLTAKLILVFSGWVKKGILKLQATKYTQHSWVWGVSVYYSTGSLFKLSVPYVTVGLAGNICIQWKVPHYSTNQTKLGFFFFKVFVFSFSIGNEGLRKLF